MPQGSSDTTDGGGRTVMVEFTPEEYERLNEVANDPAATVHDAALWRMAIAEAVVYTEAGEFAGPDGFAKLVDEHTPTWPYGALAGLETVSNEGSESRWAMDVGPEHANPMGTIHGGVLCDLGDAAMGTAYMSTVELDESFTANFLRPVRTGRLEAVGHVVHRGRRVGLVECEITNEAGKLIANLSSMKSAASTRHDHRYTSRNLSESPHAPSRPCQHHAVVRAPVILNLAPYSLRLLNSQYAI